VVKQLAKRGRHACRGNNKNTHKGRDKQTNKAKHTRGMVCRRCLERRGLSQHTNAASLLPVHVVKALVGELQGNRHVRVSVNK
jgi:hypothetical protein